MHVTIIGPGSMGRALTTRLLAGGNVVSLVGRDRRQAEEVASELRAGAGGSAAVDAAEPGTAIGKSEVVILALPYPAALDAAREHGRLLGGRVVIDVTTRWTRATPGW